MRTLASMLLAFAIQCALDWALPADMSRLLVIALAGVGGMLWASLDDLIRKKEI